MSTDLQLREFLAANPPAEEFTPHRYLGGCGVLVTHFSGDGDYSEQLTPEITVYRSSGTGEITGCRVVLPKDSPS